MSFKSNYGDYFGMVSHAVAVDVSSEDYLASSEGRKFTTCGILVGGAGDIVLELIGSEGETITYSVEDNTQLNVLAKRIVSSGTTATGIIAQY